MRLCFFELSWAEKAATHDGVLVGIVALESFGYSIRNGGFAGASSTGKPEDTRASQWTIVSPFGDVIQYLESLVLDTCSIRAHFPP